MRFPTGLAHYVYDVTLVGGGHLVVRIGRPDAAEDFVGAVQWSGVLRPLGVPLPALLEAGSHAGCPYLILERLPGTDLGDVLQDLTLAQKRVLAGEIVRVQARVGALPLGGGFGYARHRDGPFPHRTWSGVIAGALARSRARIESAGIVPSEVVTRTERAAGSHSAYFATVAPRAFLDDTTTKNVIVHEGRLRGIVDVDVVCFGDPLFPLALTHVALVDRGFDLDYTAAWRDLLAPGPEQRRALHFYIALFCVDFLAEIGHSFNRDGAIPEDAARISRLRALLDSGLAGAGGTRVR